MDNVKFYDKYYLKRNPATGEVLVDGKEPILGECAKHGCPLEPRHVTTLNRGWQNSGVYFVEVVPEVTGNTVQDDNKKNINAPNKTEDNSVKKTKKELVSDCKKMGIETSGNVIELTERLANHKG